jgi:hypothetical protein
MNNTMQIEIGDLVKHIGTEKVYEVKDLRTFANGDVHTVGVEDETMDCIVYVPVEHVTLERKGGVQ